MGLMTEDDYYSIRVYPKARKATLVFVGGCWDYNQELTFNGFVAPIIRHYAPDRIGWDQRITISEGNYKFTWPAKVLDIKGDM